jgi:hypothetical protein
VTARLKGSFLGVCLAATLAATLLPTRASAYWHNATDVLFGTAYTLPERRMRIGVFGPMSYGAHDRVTLSTHPVLDLLLVLNAALRLRVVDGPPTVSLAISYSQSFFVAEEATPEGEARLFSLLSVPIGSHLILTGSAGMGQDLARSTQLMAGTIAAHVLLSPADIIQVQGGVEQRLGGESKVEPQGMLLYVRAFRRVRIGAGVAVGTYASAPLSFLLEGENRIVPYIDAWWFF